MPAKKTLVAKEYRIQKFPGKGGWSYVILPETLRKNKTPFSWLKVKGTIDSYEIKQYNLMPMASGKLFLPIKAEIRKAIGKREGDLVKVTLFADTSRLEIPEEIIHCFENESPIVYDTFLSFTESQQKAYLDWIYEAKREETKTTRIVKMINRLIEGKNLYDL